MSGSPLRDRLLGHFDELADKLPGLEERRLAALQSFAEAGVPTPRLEDWRHTSLRPLQDVPFAARAPIVRPEAVFERIPEELRAFPRIAFANGVFCRAHSSLDALPPGLSVEPIGAVLRSEPQRIEALLGQQCDDKDQALVALNSALFRDGALITVDDGVSLEQPLWLLEAASAEQPVALHTRHLISIGAGSRATLVEQTLGGEGSLLQNTVTEIALAENASLEHVTLQQASDESFRFATLAVRQQAGSRFASHSLALGGRIARFAVSVELAGEGAHAGLFGLYLGRRDQLLDHHTTIDHATPHTTSDELFKGILDDRATGVFHGRIHVRPHAQKIGAQQQSRNLLLSDTAAIHTKPQLQIYADDVRCSHGATVGQLDPDQLFYLRARGIPEQEARALLTFGFASEIVLGLPIPALREHLRQYVLGWLPRG